MYSELWNEYLFRSYAQHELGSDPTLERKQVVDDWRWRNVPNGSISIGDMTSLLAEAKSYGVTNIWCNTSYQEEYVDFCTISRPESDEELMHRIYCILRSCRNNMWVNPAVVQAAINKALYETERASIEFKYGRISQHDFDKTWEQLSAVKQNQDKAEQKLAAAKAAWTQLQEMGLVAANDKGE